MLRTDPNASTWAEPRTSVVDPDMEGAVGDEGVRQVTGRASSAERSQPGCRSQAAACAPGRRSAVWTGVEPACANLPHHRSLSAGSAAMRVRLCHPRLHTLRSSRGARRSFRIPVCAIEIRPCRCRVPTGLCPRNRFCHSGKRSRPSSAGSLCTCDRPRSEAVGVRVGPAGLRCGRAGWPVAPHEVPTAPRNYRMRSFCRSNPVVREWPVRLGALGIGLYAFSLTAG